MRFLILFLSVAFIVVQSGYCDGAAGYGGSRKDTTLENMPSSNNGEAKEEAMTQASLDIFGGVSIPLGNTHDQWNTGFDVGAQAFIYLDGVMGLGFHFGWNRWDPKTDGFNNGIRTSTGGLVIPTGTGDTINAANVDVSGSANVLEFIPSLRMKTNYEGPFNVFGQAGFGLYVYNQKAELSGVSTITNTPATITFEDGKWLGRWGLQVGGGIELGPKNVALEIYPLYNIVFRSGTDIQYLSVNAGLVFSY